MFQIKIRKEKRIKITITNNTKCIRIVKFKYEEVK